MSEAQTAHQAAAAAPMSQSQTAHHATAAEPVATGTGTGTHTGTAAGIQVPAHGATTTAQEPAAANTTGTTTTGTTTAAASSPQFPGDAILADADTVYDQRKTIKAAPEDVWPWVLQWGKGRGGWYAPAKIEKILPEKYRSAPTINSEWQALKVGDRVPDYGLNKKNGDEYHLEVAVLENQRALVYKGERLGMNFTWALLLETPSGSAAGGHHTTTTGTTATTTTTPTPTTTPGHNVSTSSAASTASATETVLHLRFRSKSQHTGWKAKVNQRVGKVADGMMASAIFPGIIDRVERQEKTAKVTPTA